ncbi:MAG TPA: hypothetical protein VIA06_06000 [Candidatus Dormibacteraeota bacterium]|nr:hypothetical protein [Candidatus Dormibacteraeota bacterium]
MKSRSYAGPADLRLMQALLIRDYAVTHTRIGDIAWRTRYHTHHELSLEIRLWFEQEGLIAWTWLRTGGGLDLEVASEWRQDESEPPRVTWRLGGLSPAVATHGPTSRRTGLVSGY